MRSSSPELLRALGGRFDVLITLDFETYFDSEYTLRKLTTEAYVRDPRWEVHGVGVKFGERPSVWLEEPEFRDWARGVDWRRVALACHHTQFDGFALSHHYGIFPGFLLCTMSMGRALHGPARGNSLENLGPKYGLGFKGKELDKVKGKRRFDLRPEEWEALGGYCNNDVELTYGLVWKMILRLPPEELWLIDSTVRMFTEPRFVANQGVLGEALAAERARKASFLERTGYTREHFASNERFAEILQSMGEEPPTKLSPKAKNPDGSPKTIFAFAKSDPGMQALLESPREEIRFLAETRLAIKSTIIETRTERVINIGKRGRVPFYLKYCGAHTHRWSGGDKMNPQNFNRGGVLRDAMEAPPGETLVVADSGQIEARVVAWLAGERKLLDTFRQNDARTREYEAAFAARVEALGNAVTKEQAKEIDRELAAQGVAEGDFYSAVGSDFFGKPLSKKETPVERQVSKSMALGLGFGMGWFKFAMELAKGMLGAPPVVFTDKEVKQFGVNVRAFCLDRDGAIDKKKLERIRTMPSRVEYRARVIHCAVTSYLVDRYRETNRKIAKLWETMNRIIAVMEDPTDDGGRVRMTYGPIRVIRHGLTKPNGLTLHYPGLRRSSGGYTYLGGKSGREVTKIYGGSLTENVVQSLARDIVAEQALWVRARGYHLGTTTHDEIVAVVSESQGETCLEYMLERMRVAPAWCSDLPLNASGAIARTYGQAK